MSKMSRILLVEDEIILLLDLIDQLTELGFEPVPVTSSKGATSLIDSVDALVTDIELPGSYDGLKLARFAAQRRPNLPIVVVSGGVRPKAEELPKGAVFLPKPYRVDDVRAALESQRITRAA
jgi:CheY-like chemotaxis protein